MSWQNMSLPQQRSPAVAPHGWHVPPKHRRSELLQVLPGQHCVFDSPQRAQVPLMHWAPESTHAVPLLQQAWPSPPHVVLQ
jgi:hypothetical protein